MTGVNIREVNSQDAALLARMWFMDVGSGDCTLVIDVVTKLAVLVDCPTWHVDYVRRLLLEEDATLYTVIVADTCPYAR